MAHNATSLPHINYRCIICGRCPNQVKVDRICKLQKQAAQVIWAPQVILIYKIQDILFNKIFRKMNLLSIHDRMSYKHCLIVKNNLVPHYMLTFTPVSVVHDHNTRSVAWSDLYASCANLKYYTRSFQYEGTRLWSNISGPIQRHKSIHVFKRIQTTNYFTH